MFVIVVCVGVRKREVLNLTININFNFVVEMLLSFLLSFGGFPKTFVRNLTSLILTSIILHFYVWELHIHITQNEVSH